MASAVTAADINKTNHATRKHKLVWIENRESVCFFRIEKVKRDSQSLPLHFIYLDEMRLYTELGMATWLSDLITLFKRAFEDDGCVLTSKWLHHPNYFGNHYYKMFYEDCQSFLPLVNGLEVHFIEHIDKEKEVWVMDLMCLANCLETILSVYTANHIKKKNKREAAEKKHKELWEAVKKYEKDISDASKRNDHKEETEAAAAAAEKKHKELWEAVKKYKKDIRVSDASKRNDHKEETEAAAAAAASAAAAKAAALAKASALAEAAKP